MDHVLRSSGYETSAIEVVRARDCILYTADGRELIDFEAGVWAVALGHAHPRIVRTIQEQLRRISHIAYRVTSPLQESAAAEVLRAVDFADGQCVFLSSGSEAVEFGVQIARRVSGRPLLLTLEETFLGSYGSAGTKSPDEWALFDRNLCRDCPPKHECSLDCPHLAEIPFDQVGALVFEPGSSGGLVRFPPERLIRALRDGVRAHGGRVVVNEITTGVGRTGTWFGFQHAGLRPDIVAIGKGLGNGYPVSAVAMRSSVIEELRRTDFRYAQSHQNDPLACAVAEEVLRTVREEELVERSARIGAFFRQELERLARHHDVIREARGRGLMLAIEFLPDRDGFALRNVFDELLDRGFLVGYKPERRLLRFLPPLTIPKADITRLLEALGDTLKQTTG